MPLYALDDYELVENLNENVQTHNSSTKIYYTRQ